MRSMDQERQYLEQLLNTRFNFHLVFSSLFIVGIYTADLEGKASGIALIMGAIISLVIALSVLRTTWLVEEALKILRSDAKHPYTTLYEAVRWKPPFVSANIFIAITPWLISIALFVLGGIALTDSSSVSTTVGQVGELAVP